MYELRIYRGVICHDNEELCNTGWGGGGGGGGWAGGGLTCRVKIDMRNLTDFDTSTQKSKI